MRSVMMNLFVQPLGRNLRFFHSVRIQTIQFLALMSCPRNKHIFRCDQNGPPARRSEPDWQWEGAYLERYVTDPAAAGQPPAHFHRNPPGRGQLAVFPRCSLLTYRFRYDRRSRLEKQSTDLRRKACLFRGQDIGAFPDKEFAWLKSGTHTLGCQIDLGINVNIRREPAIVKLALS